MNTIQLLVYQAFNDELIRLRIWCPRCSVIVSEQNE